MDKYKSVILLILDGWGVSPSWGGNAISMNNPDIMNYYWRNYPHTVLQAFKKIVGPSGKVGNSEIGHSSIGTGRLIFQDMTRIGNSIIDGSFMTNPTLLKAADYVRAHNSALHIYGLLSDGGIHAHVDHAIALADFAKSQNITKTYFHCVLDGRDAGATSALSFISQLDDRLKSNNLGRIASLVGRFYALDRDEHWSRIAVAYKAMAEGIGDRFSTAEEAISAMYRKGFEDEFMPPCVINDGTGPVTIKDGDAVICFNFRADRARQLAQVFLGTHKLGMFFHLPKDLFFAGMTSYRLPEQKNIIFDPIPIKNPLAKIISDDGLKQFHIAESEKYAHVTYFFNGGREDAFPGEDRLFVPSPDVISYNQAPEMSAQKLTDELVAKLHSERYTLLVANYANVDMVGHTGDIAAVATAVATVDAQVRRVIQEGLRQDAAIIITADHGNAEQMIGLHRDKTSETMHTLNPVPFILIAKSLAKGADNSKPDNLLSDIAQSEHTLADVAPTILELLGLSKPDEMTGHSLIGQLN